MKTNYTPFKRFYDTFSFATLLFIIIGNASCKKNIQHNSAQNSTLQYYPAGSEFLNISNVQAFGNNVKLIAAYYLGGTACIAKSTGTSAKLDWIINLGNAEDFPFGKEDANGIKLFSKDVYQRPSNTFIVDNENKFMICGQYHNEQSSSKIDFFVGKYSIDGNQLFFNTYSFMTKADSNKYPSYIHQIESFIGDGSGGCYLTVTFRSINVGYAYYYYLVHISNTGVLDWKCKLNLNDPLNLVWAGADNLVGMKYLPNNFGDLTFTFTALKISDLKAQKSNIPVWIQEIEPSVKDYNYTIRTFDDEIFVLNTNQGSPLLNGLELHSITAVDGVIKKNHVFLFDNEINEISELDILYNGNEFGVAWSEPGQGIKMQIFDNNYILKYTQAIGSLDNKANLLALARNKEYVYISGSSSISSSGFEIPFMYNLPRN